MTKIEEHSKNILRLRKGQELLFWILQKITETTCFSVHVHQCNIAFSVVHVQVYFVSFLIIIIFLSCRPG